MLATFFESDPSTAELVDNYRTTPGPEYELSSTKTLSKVDTTSCCNVAAAVLETAIVLDACSVAHISSVLARSSPLRKFE